MSRRVEFRGRTLALALLMVIGPAVTAAQTAGPSLALEAKKIPLGPVSGRIRCQGRGGLALYLHHGFRRFASRSMRLYLPLAEAARRLGAS